MYLRDQKTISKFVGEGADSKKMRGKRRILSELEIEKDQESEEYFEENDDLSDKYFSIEKEAKMMSLCDLDPKSKKDHKKFFPESQKDV